MPLIAINGVIPDLVLLATVSYAFLRGSAWGAFVGFLFGLIEDLILNNCRVHSSVYQAEMSPNG